MNGFMSKVLKISNPAFCQTTFFKFNVTFNIVRTLVVFKLLLLSACKPSTAPDYKLEEERIPQNSAKIENSIIDSYARFAAKKSDVCPKLVEQNIDSPEIKRTSEIMVDDYCDYFLYLHKGDSITVDVSDSQLEALLMVPAMHNFANGSYAVTSYDKHIIRLTYKGSSYRPERLRYNVMIQVTK